MAIFSQNEPETPDSDSLTLVPMTPTPV
jgi:hypothetical protein